MKHVAWLVLVAGLCLVGCNGSHHSSTTEPSSAPTIMNLKAFPVVRSDATTGVLPLSFDYADPNGDVSEVVLRLLDEPAFRAASEHLG